MFMLLFKLLKIQKIFMDILIFRIKGILAFVIKSFLIP
jgi:hypothetical protein